MSNLMLRRETIIALRARHTAFRIAVDILYPPQPPPASVQPTTVSDEEVDRAMAEWETQRRREAELAKEDARNRWRLIAIASVPFVLLIAYLIYDSVTQPSPPPPPARPILPAPRYPLD
jgi:hypothetical protein